MKRTVSKTVMPFATSQKRLILRDNFSAYMQGAKYHATVSLWGLFKAIQEVADVELQTLLSINGASKIRRYTMLLRRKLEDMGEDAFVEVDVSQHSWLHYDVAGISMEIDFMQGAHILEVELGIDYSASYTPTTKAMGF